jgi:hypothetical protein
MVCGVYLVCDCFFIKQSHYIEIFSWIQFHPIHPTMPTWFLNVNVFIFVLTWVWMDWMVGWLVGWFQLCTRISILGIISVVYSQWIISHFFDAFDRPYFGQKNDTHFILVALLVVEIFPIHHSTVTLGKNLHLLLAPPISKHVNIKTIPIRVSSSTTHASHFPSDIQPIHPPIASITHDHIMHAVKRERKVIPNSENWMEKKVSLIYLMHST